MLFLPASIYYMRLSIWVYMYKNPKGRNPQFHGAPTVVVERLQLENRWTLTSEQITCWRGDAAASLGATVQTEISR